MLFLSFPWSLWNQAVGFRWRNRERIALSQTISEARVLAAVVGAAVQLGISCSSELVSGWVLGTPRPGPSFLPQELTVWAGDWQLKAPGCRGQGLHV